MAKKTLPIALESHEAKALLDAVHLRYPSGIRNRAILEVMLHAGFRISEVMALRPGHIRWKAKILEVHKGKGGRDRNIPVDSETIRRLRDWQAVRPRGSHISFAQETEASSAHAICSSWSSVWHAVPVLSGSNK